MQLVDRTTFHRREPCTSHSPPARPWGASASLLVRPARHLFILLISPEQSPPHSHAGPGSPSPPGSVSAAPACPGRRSGLSGKAGPPPRRRGADDGDRCARPPARPGLGLQTRTTEPGDAARVRDAHTRGRAGGGGGDGSGGGGAGDKGRPPEQHAAPSRANQWRTHATTKTTARSWQDDDKRTPDDDEIHRASSGGGRAARPALGVRTSGLGFLHRKT